MNHWIRKINQNPDNDIVSVIKGGYHDKEQRIS